MLMANKQTTVNYINYFPSMGTCKAAVLDNAVFLPQQIISPMYVSPQIAKVTPQIIPKPLSAIRHT
jgi:hypothetical protein